MSEVATREPQLRFPEFSDSLIKGALGDYALIKRGAGSQYIEYSKDSKDSKDSIRLIRIGDFLGGDAVFVRLTNAIQRFLLDEGDILIAGTGATAGITFLVPTKFVGMAYSYNAPKIKVHKDNVSFFYQYLISPKIKIQQIRLFTGNAQPFLDTNAIKGFSIFKPPLQEQQKIAAFLTAVDNKIEQLSKKQALLGEYKKGLMQKIFSQAIRFKADDGSDFPDWEDGLLNTLIDNSRKIRYGIVQPGKYDKNGKYLIRGKDYSNGWEIPSEFFKVSDAIEKKYSKTRVKKGDVIVCIVGSVGNVMVIPGWLDGANITQTTARIAPDKNKLNNQYLYFYFQSLVGRNMIHKHTRVGTRPGLNIEDVEKFSILLPSLLEQAKIANFLSSIDNKIEQVGKQLDESKQFKKALLQQMFV